MNTIKQINNLNDLKKELNFEVLINNSPNIMEKLNKIDFQAFIKHLKTRFTNHKIDI